MKSQAEMRQPAASIDWADGSLHAPAVKDSIKTLAQLRSAFQDQHAAEQMSPETVIYRVQWLEPQSSSSEGGLFWGNTTIEAGRVGEEYFMTHGHFHQKASRGEFYATIAGQGKLVLMKEDRTAWTEEMVPGSLHYIPGFTAHRVVNTGGVPLRFVACWPSDAGHDHASIAEKAFSIRVFCRGGEPVIVRSAG